MERSIIQKSSERSTIKGYKKGNSTQKRLVEAAIKVFSERSYREVTTRSIADEAGVNLPAIKYYFGNKEGLHLACADHVIALYNSQLIPKVKIDSEISREQALQMIEDRMKGLMTLIVSTGTLGHASRYAQSIIRHRGEAYERLYTFLWEPGTNHIAKLVAIARQRETANQDDVVMALLIISTSASLTIGKNVTLRTLNWPEIRTVNIDAIMVSLRLLISSI